MRNIVLFAILMSLPLLSGAQTPPLQFFGPIPTNQGKPGELDHREWLSLQLNILISAYGHDEDLSKVSLRDLNLSGSKEDQVLLMQNFLQYRDAERTQDDDRRATLDDDLRWARQMGLPLNQDSFADVSAKLRAVSEQVGGMVSRGQITADESFQQTIMAQWKAVQSFPVATREALRLALLDRRADPLKILEDLIDDPETMTIPTRTALILKALNQVPVQDINEKNLRIMNRAVKLLDFSKQQDVCQSISEFQYWVPGQDGESLNEKQKPYYKILTKGFAALAQNPKMDCSPYVSKEYLQGVISQVEKLNLYPKDYFVLISGRLTTAPMALANCRIDKIYRDHVVVELHADEKLRPGQIRLWSAVSAGDCTLTVQNEKLKRGYRTRFFYRDAQQNVLLQMEENFQDIAQIEAGILQGKNPPGAKPRPPVRTLSLSN